MCSHNILFSFIREKWNKRFRKERWKGKSIKFIPASNRRKGFENESLQENSLKEERKCLFSPTESKFSFLSTQPHTCFPHFIVAIFTTKTSRQNSGLYTACLHKITCIVEIFFESEVKRKCFAKRFTSKSLLFSLRQNDNARAFVSSSERRKNNIILATL